MSDLPTPQKTFPRLLADKAARNGAKPFILFEDRQVSYAELDLRSNRVANGLAKLGVKRGEHVAFLLNNCPEVLLVYFALFKLGAVVVPLNVAAKGELLVYFLEQSDATLLIAEAGLVERYRQVQHRLPRIRRLVVLREESAAEGASEALAKTIPIPVSDYRELEQEPPTPPGIDVRFCDLGYLSYTSGTTGSSKGSMATHAHEIGRAHV